MSPRALVFVATLLVAAAPTMARAQPVPIDGGLVFCASDSDCGNPYLACAPTSLSICRRDPDASATNAALADAALCPAMSQEVLDLCVVRYQLPCDASASCGPAGFTCAANGTLCNSAGCMQEMRCQSQYTLCSSDSDCPAGWSCYSPAGGAALPPDAGAQAAPKACYPPFAMFNGPARGGGGLAGPGGPGAFTDAGTGPDASSPPGGSGGGGCAVASSRTAAPSPWLIAAAIAAIARRRRAR